MKRALILIALAALMCSCGTTRVPSNYIPDEEVVDIGYGTIRKSASTYSTSRVKMNERESVVYTDMYDYLRGRVPGVSVSADKRITIRGIGSINSSIEPLILLDGVTITDLSTISPSDVESVDVLKDSSTSMYGVRGANGVIIIKTKHGK